MRNKLDKLRHLIQKLGSRYGHEDDDVKQLKLELDALEAIANDIPTDQRIKLHHKYSFQTVAKRNFYDASNSSLQ